jgi:hypothetical protein
MNPTGKGAIEQAARIVRHRLDGRISTEPEREKG